jgi:Domain of unknown function (DU1801)
MADIKTKPTDQSVTAFLEGVENESRRKDGLALLALMQEATGMDAQMWGTSIVGFGSYHYKYDSGREGDMMQVGFSPRKQSLTLYIRGGFEQYTPFLDKLGKHKRGKGCLYINKLAEVDLNVLRQIVSQSVEKQV